MKLVRWPDPILKQKAEEVDINDSVNLLVEEMFGVMYHSNGIGLAAAQVGVLKRLFVMHVEPFKRFAMINPEIVDASEKKVEVEEGCLSFPGITVKVKRSKEITVRWVNLDREEQEESFSGSSAVCVQHEIDHLDGIVFLDYISQLKRDILEKRLEK